jgi:hypothetical protein
VIRVAVLRRGDTPSHACHLGATRCAAAVNEEDVMRQNPETSDSIAELHRELNALCGLLQFAQDRCYPEPLKAQLEQMLAEANRRRLSAA